MTNIDINAFFSKIISLANDKGLTLNGLSERAGLSTGLIYRWVQKKRLPSLESVFKICNALDVPIEYLLSNKSGTVKDNKIELITLKAKDLTEEQLTVIYSMMNLLTNR